MFKVGDTVYHVDHDAIRICWVYYIKEITSSFNQSRQFPPSKNTYKEIYYGLFYFTSTPEREVFATLKEAAIEADRLGYTDLKLIDLRKYFSKEVKDENR